MEVAGLDGQDRCLLPTQVTFPELRWQSQNSPRNAQASKSPIPGQARKLHSSKRRIRSELCLQPPEAGRSEALPCTSSEPSIDAACDKQLLSAGPICSQDQGPTELEPLAQDETCSEETRVTLRADFQLQPNQQVRHPHSIMPWIAPIGSETRTLLSHCKQTHPRYRFHFAVS